MSKTFACNSADDNRDGLNDWSVLPVGSGSTSGIITDD